MKANPLTHDTPIFQLTVGQFLELLQSTDRTAPTPKKEASEFMTVSELQDLTGYSRPTIYAKTSSNLIPHFKRDGRLFFRRSEITEWLTENRIKTIKETLIEFDRKLTKRRAKA